MADKEAAKKKIVLIDDHPLLRKGLTLLIQQEKDMVVCGEAEDASSALKVIHDTRPDVAVVDLSLKDSNGIDLIKDIRIREPKVLVLVLSMHDETFYAERVLRAGARGYITKAEDSSKVVEGIRQVLQGKIFVSDATSARMLSKFVGDKARTAESSIDTLTDREFEVLELIGNGTQSREIAERLHLSIKTVDAHRENIKRKLKLADASELLKYAIKWAQTQKPQ